jgi:hypothetical protein
VEDELDAAGRAVLFDTDNRIDSSTQTHDGAAKRSLGALLKARGYGGVVGVKDDFHGSSTWRTTLAAATRAKDMRRGRGDHALEVRGSLAGGPLPREGLREGTRGTPKLFDK